MMLQKLRDGGRPRARAARVVRARHGAADGDRRAAQRPRGASGSSRRSRSTSRPQPRRTPEPLDTKRLGRCLAALPERERAVLVMTFYDDRPADAVASELGLSAGNVRVIRHRGLERLRGCMHGRRR